MFIPYDLLKKFMNNIAQEHALWVFTMVFCFVFPSTGSNEGIHYCVRSGMMFYMSTLIFKGVARARHYMNTEQCQHVLNQSPK